jgi:hypothetical protein
MIRDIIIGASNGNYSYIIEYLIIGGGAAGSAGYGINNPSNAYANGSGSGGGGAGGYISGTAEAAMTYLITVGAGGTMGTNGTSSSFMGIIAAGGGSGGRDSSGQNGGSGGGAGFNNIMGTGISGQGHPGGGKWQYVFDWIYEQTVYSFGGGGGAGGPGGSGHGNYNAYIGGGPGGPGATWLDGVTRAGGGAGGYNSTLYAAILGEAGSGGAAGGTPSLGTFTYKINADPNTGSGGMGDSRSSGGSGVVIIRYLGSQRGTGGIVTSAGGYTYHTFNSSGTFIP